MANIAAMMTSKSCEWETPEEFYQKLNAEFKFTQDVCATKENAKHHNFFTKEEDALSVPWRGTCWMNPPYGRGIGKWLQKAYLSAVIEGAIVVCLIPARTDTAYWHDYCIKGEIRFIRGRLKFNNHKGNAPFPSAVVIFRPIT